MTGRNVFPVGGKPVLQEGDTTTKRTPETMVPMSWHSGPEELYAELLYDYGKVVVAMTTCMGD
eukprot:6557541-Prorocentrum_lima.AAC.1